MVNEFEDRELDCNSCDGEPTCTPCDPLETYGIDTDLMWMNIGLLAVIGFLLRCVAMLFLYVKTIRRKRLR